MNDITITFKREEAIYLKELGADPLKLVQFFVENDYKISIDGFLSKNYITVEELFAKTTYK